MQKYTHRIEETLTEEMYNDILDEQGDVEVAGQTFSPSRVLKRLDPTAYTIGFNERQEYKSVYTCTNCGEEFPTAEEAEDCYDEGD